MINSKKLVHMAVNNDVKSSSEEIWQSVPAASLTATIVLSFEKVL